MHRCKIILTRKDSFKKNPSSAFIITSKRRQSPCVLVGLSFNLNNSNFWKIFCIVLIDRISQCTEEAGLALHRWTVKIKWRSRRELRHCYGKTLNSLFCDFLHRFILWERNPWGRVDGENQLSCGYYCNGRNLYFTCLYAPYANCQLPKITHKKIICLGKELTHVPCVFSPCVLH